MNIKNYTHILAAKLTNQALSLLRNRTNLELSREEFRSSNISFSQFGEDILLLSYFNDYKEKQGFYVDVGAFHPFKLSNTMLLYKLGWHGLNIDCDKEKIDLFNKLRPRDINICAAVANANKEMTLLQYPMSATNRLSDKNDQLSLCGEIPNSQLSVNTKSLNMILEEISISMEEIVIDYLNVDVEGLELQVLEGLDFNKYAPKLISVEIMNSKDQVLISQLL
ncbi:MAG: FkbM family methyltransferase [Aphanizomenon gracile PMC644.10]|nr:FkbM family methyltransferase [Aphanizomenon gracile PMC644.10]